MWLTLFFSRFSVIAKGLRRAGEALDGLRSAGAAGFGERVRAWMRRKRSPPRALR